MKAEKEKSNRICRIRQERMKAEKEKSNRICRIRQDRKDSKFNSI